MHASNRQWLSLGLAAILVAVGSAFSATPIGTRKASSLTKLLGEPSDDRRDFLKQAGFIAGALLLGPGVARAGLLDEYGSDPSKIAVAEKPKEVVAAVAKKAGEVQIDPTLRACKCAEKKKRLVV